MANSKQVCVHRCTACRRRQIPQRPVPPFNVFPITVPPLRERPVQSASPEPAPSRISLFLKNGTFYRNWVRRHGFAPFAYSATLPPLTESAPLVGDCETRTRRSPGVALGQANGRSLASLRERRSPAVSAI